MEIKGQGIRYTTQPLNTTLFHQYPMRFKKIISLNVQISRDIIPDPQRYDIDILVGSSLNTDGFYTNDIRRTINANYYTFYTVTGFWK